MKIKTYLPHALARSASVFVFVIVSALALASCVPSGSMDLYGSANSNQMTANAALLLAQYQRDAMTATAQAPIVHITETAAAVTVQAAQAQSTSVAAAQTQMGGLTATAVWWTATPNLDSTATVAALNAQSTEIANRAIRDQLQLEREIKNNEWNRLVGGLALIFGAGLILILVNHYLRRQRYQTAKVDARGNVLPLLDIVEGSFTDMDRSPNFQGPISQETLARILAWWFKRKIGMPQLPEVTAKRQDEMTQRDQLIDLASRGLPESGPAKREMKKLAAQEMTKQLSASSLQSRYKILDGSSNNLDVIDGEVIQVLDQDWKEAKKA